MNTPRQSLSLDLDSLFPGETLKIGNSQIIIKPLNIEQIALITKKLKGLGKILSDEGVTWENYNEQSSMFSIATTLITNFPDILEEASNVAATDLNKLPIEIIIEIINKVIDVNLKSKETLTKNFKSLTEKFIQTETKVVKKKQK